MGRAWAKRLTRRTNQDAKRSKAWSKSSRAIMVAARNGGGDPDTNATLKLAIEEARNHNMPKDTIEKAISKGSGSGSEGADYEQCIYEGYAPGGVALLIEALTNNRNRTAPDVRISLDKNGGSFASSGSVAFQFERKGEIFIASGAEEDKVMEVALDAGAEDVEGDADDGYRVICDASDFLSIKQALEDAGFECESAQVGMFAQNSVAVSGEIAEQVHKIIDALEDNDDVQKVHTNADFGDEE